MRYLVLTDIHANLEALDVCLADARARGYDETLVLGDLVGYGPDPNAVIDRVRDLNPAALVRGNHDKVACGLEQAEGFNMVAKSAAVWTFDTLTPAHREWLAALPEGPREVDDLIEICHGSPFDEDAYIFDELDAYKAFEVATRPVCLFGHTHVALAFRRVADRLELPAGPGDTDQVRIPIDPGARFLVNVGSVGQPRDNDSRAGAGIVDTSAGVIELYRVRYPIEEAQRKIRMAGLPEILARRLALGR
jgi:diadenosine tetraphosphatase ApaH/serine/threonine PP2A family protein phosphatase